MEYTETVGADAVGLRQPYDMHWSMHEKTWFEKTEQNTDLSIDIGDKVKCSSWLCITQWVILQGKSSLQSY